MTVRLVLCLGLLFAALTSAAEPIPFRAVYKADYKGLPISAVGVRELTALGDNRFRFTSSAKSFFAAITESSTFVQTENELIPQQYEYHRSGIGKNKRIDVQFDWQAGIAGNRAERDPWQIDVDPETLDRLLYQYKLREDLQAAMTRGEPWPELTYKIADDARVRLFHFRVIGEEDIDTPIGRLHTIKATRVREDSERETTFWLAPLHDFMLVRFEQVEENGKGFELHLTEASIAGKPIKGE